MGRKARKRKAEADLAKAIENLVVPELIAREYREAGVDVYTTQVSRNLLREGTLVTCSGCGIQARMQGEVPEGKIALC